MTKSALPDRATDRPRVGLHILPSSMTVLAICAGLTSIKYALDGQPHLAMALIAAAAILDGLDGRVARILDAESRMGAEIDSLADAVDFGVAPAVVIYVTLLSTQPAGWIVVLLYAVCVVLRLARFNTLLDDATLPAYTREFFVGMRRRPGRSRCWACWPPSCSSARVGGRRSGSPAPGWWGPR